MLQNISAILQLLYYSKKNFSIGPTMSSCSSQEKMQFFCLALVTISREGKSLGQTWSKERE